MPLMQHFSRVLTARSRSKSGKKRWLAGCSTWEKHQNNSKRVFMMKYIYRSKEEMTISGRCLSFQEIYILGSCAYRKHRRLSKVFSKHSLEVFWLIRILGITCQLPQRPTPSPILTNSSPQAKVQEEKSLGGGTCFALKGHGSRLTC